MNTRFIKQVPAHPELLHMLVSAYNQSIQTYFYFPEVIICGQQRLAREVFNVLAAKGFVTVYRADSFGCYFRLSKTGVDFLFHSLYRPRKKHAAFMPPAQRQLPFGDYC